MNLGTCKHFTGTYLNKTCKAGICYRDVTTDPDAPGSGLRIPCHGQAIFTSPHQLQEFDKRGKCEKYEEPTNQDISDHNAMMRKAVENMTVVGNVLIPIRKEHKGKNWQGTIKCPVCKGEMHLTHAGCNNHMRVYCETEDCVRWME